MTINLSTRFTAESLTDLEALIAEHGDYVRSGGHVTYGQIVQRMENKQADRRRQAEAEAARAAAAGRVGAAGVAGLDRSTTLSTAQVQALVSAAVAGSGGRITVGSLIDAVSRA